MKNDTDKRQKLIKKKYNVEDQHVSNFVPFWNPKTTTKNLFIKHKSTRRRLNKILEARK